MYGKDGSPRSGMARAKFADEVHARKAAPKHDKFAEGHGDKMGEVGAPDIHAVVKEHGPAHEVHIHHDHEAQHSHVVSHHGEHQHEEHFHGEDHVWDAHDHAKDAAGEGSDGKDRREKEEMAEEQVEPGIHSEVADMLA